MSFTAACTKCNKTFMADSYAKAKSARDVHRRTCVSSFQVEYPNAMVTLSRQSDTGDFICICSLYPAGHSFNSTHNVKKHVTLTKCHWVGPTEVRTRPLLFPIGKNNGTQTGPTAYVQQPSVAMSAMAMDIDEEPPFAHQPSTQRTTSILVNDSQLIQPPYLHTLGFAYNTVLPGLICLACAIAIAPSHIVEHMKNKHADSGLGVNRTLLEQDVQFLGVQDNLPFLDLTLRPELQGLAVHTALQCGACSKVYVAQSAMMQHHQEEHRPAPMPRSWTTVHAQQLNHTLHRSFFPVIPATPANIDPTQVIVNNLHSDMVALDGRPTGHRLDPRLVSPWLKSNRWPELIQGKSVESLRAMIAPLKENEYPTLVPAIQELFIGSEELFELVPELVLQRINTPDPVKT
ncbi:hypothetical protein C0993_009690 [Termitomyces sp. T159_Od127]|nr:hypothetical protein C0993_009690 [Termitomyces sp. T159_Od127]